MQFEIQVNPSRRAGAEVETFTVERLLSAETGAARDLSHLIDRSYRYQSMRELRWHLAERFRVPVAGVAIRAA